MRVAGPPFRGPRVYGGRDASLWDRIIFEEESYRVGAPQRLPRTASSCPPPLVFAFGTRHQHECSVSLTLARWSRRAPTARRPCWVSSDQPIPQHLKTRPVPANATNIIDTGRGNMSRTRQRKPTQQTPTNTDYESAGYRRTWRPGRRHRGHDAVSKPTSARH